MNTVFCNPTYEDRLSQDLHWALDEGGLFFDEQGSVYESLHRIVAHLNEWDVEYAVTGGLALVHHGYRRFTENIDIIVTDQGWRKIYDHLVGNEYWSPSPHSRLLRDSETGVRIKLWIVREVRCDQSYFAHENAIRYVDLKMLIEVKLWPGIVPGGRLRHHIDAQELLKRLPLLADFSELLDETVRPNFLEHWNLAQSVDPYCLHENA